MFDQQLDLHHPFLKFAFEAPILKFFHRFDPKIRTTGKKLGFPLETLGHQKN